MPIKEYASPKTMQAPSGEYAKPQIRTFQRGNTTIEEAHYYDPRTGQFFYKTVLREITPDKKSE